MKIFSKIGYGIFVLAMVIPLKGMEKKEKMPLWHFILRNDYLGSAPTTESEIKNKITLLNQVAQEAGLNKSGSNLAMLLYLRKTATQKGGQLGVSGTSISEEEVGEWRRLLLERGLISKAGQLDRVVRYLLIVCEGSPNLLDWNYLTKARKILNEEEGKNFIQREAKRKSESDQEKGESWYFDLPFGTESLKTTKKAIEQIYGELILLNKEYFLYFANLVGASKMFLGSKDFDIENFLKERGLLADDGTPKLLAEFLYGCAIRPFSEIMDKQILVKEMFLPLKELFGVKIYQKKN